MAIHTDMDWESAPQCVLRILEWQCKIFPHILKQKSPIPSLLPFICIGLTADSMNCWRNCSPTRKKSAWGRAKCRRRDLNIGGQRSKLKFKPNLLSRGANTITFRDLCHKLGCVELAVKGSVSFRSQLSTQFENQNTTSMLREWLLSMDSFTCLGAAWEFLGFVTLQFLLWMRHVSKAEIHRQFQLQITAVRV